MYAIGGTKNLHQLSMSISSNMVKCSDSPGIHKYQDTLFEHRAFVIGAACFKAIL